jgi:hypothetical protein
MSLLRAERFRDEVGGRGCKRGSRRLHSCNTGKSGWHCPSSCRPALGVVVHAMQELGLLIQQVDASYD